MSGRPDRKTSGRNVGVVIIGFAEALSAPEVAWNLVDAGFTVIAFSRKGRRAALRQSRLVRVVDITAPELSTELALRELSTLLDSPICQSPSRYILFPLDDASLWLCTHLPPGGNWIRAAPVPEIAALAFDKEKQVNLAKASGFNVPESFIAFTAADFNVARATLPVIIRPAAAICEQDGRFRKGQNWICNSPSELEGAVTAWAKLKYPVLIQPFVTGKGEGVFGLAQNGNVIAWSAHRRLRMMNPHGSGSSACISRPVDEELKTAAAEMTRRAKWNGLFMIELLRGNDGKVWFVEFNGRPWGSMALACRTGFDYPAWAVRQSLDPNYKIELRDAPPVHPVICRNVGRELMHFLFVLRGPKSGAIKEWPGVFRTLLNLIPIGGRNSFYNFRLNDLRVFASDCWITLHDNLIKSRH